MLKKILLALVVVSISFFLITVLFIVPISRKKFQQYDSLKKKIPVYFYYYFNSDSTLREGLYVTKLKDVDSLINYYKELDKGIEPEVGFDLNLIGVKDSVYILHYMDSDSLIANIIYDDSISYNNKGYVYTPLLHRVK